MGSTQYGDPWGKGQPPRNRPAAYRAAASRPGRLPASERNAAESRKVVFNEHLESLAAAGGPRQLRNPRGDNSALFRPDDPRLDPFWSLSAAEHHDFAN